MPPKTVWMNGKFVDWKNANVHVLTHALNYGSAIFEGMRCYATKDGPAIFRMKDHYHRMSSGAKSYEFSLDYSVETLCKATKQLIKKNKMKEAYIRPLLYCSKVGIGLDLTDSPFGFAIAAIKMGGLYGKKSERGLACQISNWKRISSMILSPHVKASANYLNSSLAKLEARGGGFDEAIMLSEEGHVSEATGENLFIIRDGELVTPPIYDSILAGITRDSIITLAKEMDLKVKEQSILRDELYTADEIFLSGTAAEITPVISVDRRKIGRSKAGPITTNIRETFFNVVRGKDERFTKWLDYV